MNFTPNITEYNLNAINDYNQFLQGHASFDVKNNEFEEALEKAAAIEKFGKLELSAKAGESGKLFGTITTKKLAEELQAQAGIEVDRKSVSLNAPINKIGNYVMLIKLTSKVKSELNVVVTASEVVKESIEESSEESAE